MEELLMEKLSDQGRLRPWMGFVLFGVLMAFFIFVCAPLQQNLGIPGLVITELAFLAMAVIYCLIRKVKIKEVFPVKKVKVREVIGCILLVLGIFPVSLMLVALTAIIFPQAASEVGELNSFIFGNLNFPLAVLIVALLPAICEEAIHFGINHMSVLRFLTTMTLGLFLSYVVVKKNNIILSMIMHFTNNFISVAISYALGQNGAAVSSSATVDYSAVIGTYMVIGFASPILITLGIMLVYPEGHKKIRFLYAGVMAAALLVGGFMINAGNAKKNMILSTTIGYLVTADDKDNSMIDFTVGEDRDATVVVTIMNAEGDYKVRIDGDKGSNIINAPVPKGMVRMITYNVSLQADHYVITVEAENNAVGEKPQIQITIG